jgi:hypothetical protein
MATFSDSVQGRSDYRCSICRQKSAFHCEHNTPYRDQFLDTYGQEKPYDQRDSQRTRSNQNNNSANNNRMQNMNTGRNKNSNVDAQYRQNRRSYKNSFPNTNDSVKPKKKKKSCVIS